MDSKESQSTPQDKDKADTASRREFMKVAGVGALGLIYARPAIKTLATSNSVTSYSLSPDEDNGQESLQGGPHGI